MGNGFDVFDAVGAVAVELPLVASLLNLGIQALDPVPFVEDFLKNGPQPWQQPNRFRTSEDTLLHGYSYGFALSGLHSQPLCTLWLRPIGLIRSRSCTSLMVSARATAPPRSQPCT